MRNGKVIPIKNVGRNSVSHTTNEKQQRENMNLSLATLKNAEEPLKKVLGCTSFDILLAYKLSKLNNKIKSELNDLEDMRVKLVHKYGKLDKSGQIVVQPNNLVKFHADMNKVLSQEIELQKVEVKLEDLAGANLSPADLAALEFLIKE